MKLHAPAMASFLASMGKVDGCWNWPKYKNKDGYGLTKLNGKTSIASRVAYRLAKGEIPDGMNVCHSCDNPSCCNPSHLFLGTQKDNCQDAKAKDRHCRGERNGNAVLNDDAVRYIRANPDGLKQVQLAKKFRIRQSSIWFIQNKRQWAHVQD